MIYIVEIWNVKQAWLDLSLDERGAYMNQVGNAITDLVSQGVEVLTWSNNDPSTANRIDENYFAIWTFPNQNLADVFLETVEKAGWYNYFEQVNLMGAKASVEEVIGQLIQL